MRKVTAHCFIRPDYGMVEDELGRIEDIVNDVRSSHCTRGSGMVPMLDEDSDVAELANAVADLVDKVDDIRRILEDIDLDKMVGINIETTDAD